MKRLAPAMVAVAIAAGAVTLSAGAASAAPPGTGAAGPAPCPDNLSGCADPGTYQVIGTGGAPLNLHSSYSTDSDVVAVLYQGVPVDVSCQVNYGGDDAADGYFSHTWDFVEVNTTNGVYRGWVYDYFVNTPPQDVNGWSINKSCQVSLKQQKRQS